VNIDEKNNHYPGEEQVICLWLIRIAFWWFVFHLAQACSSFYVVRETSGKFCLHADNKKFSTQNGG
jgi:hypothetical protein